MDVRYLDRISEGYKGDLGIEAMKQAKKRIDWICAKSSKGKTILDVGCSQGITSLLLGRSGKIVTGIDTEISRIQYAENDLKKEPELKEKVKFLCDDFLTFPIDQKFDCIIMGGILEHLFDPIPFLEKAEKILEENGRLIVTVPFGINLVSDHKRTYYFTELFDQINKRLVVTDVCFFGGWIGFVADKTCENSGIEINDKFVRELEGNFYYLDSTKQKKISMVMDRNEAIKKKLKVADKEISFLNKKIGELKKKNSSMCHLHSEEMELVKEHYIKQIKLMDNEINRLNMELELIQGKCNEVYNANDEINIEGRPELPTKMFAIEENKEEKLLSGQANSSENYNEVINWGIEYSRNLVNELKAELDEKDRKLEDVETEVGIYKSKIESLARSRKKLSNDLEMYNTLLYRAKRKNETYEKFPEVKFYNWFKRKKEQDVGKVDTIYECLHDENNKELQRKIKYCEEMKSIAEDIPDSNGTRYFGKFNVRIGIIADEFQLETYRDVAETIYFSPKNYKADIDILFITSTWHGLKNDWTGLGRLNEEGGVKEDIRKIIEYHRSKGAKIIFYSKEDPGNYNVFCYIAQQCDYIFTTDIDCVEKYIEDTGNSNVFVLPFAVNPLIHNPIGFEDNMRDEVSFAGTWGYADKYPERNIDMAILFDGVMGTDKPLRIFDRNFYAKNSAYQYPIKYSEHVYPSIEHDILMKMHKLFKWTININSSKYSETMFASRVYELQACGNLIISNFNIGMKKMFPNIFIEFVPHLIKETFDRLTPKKEYELQLEGIRRIYRKETVYHRLDYILNKIGLQEYQQTLEKKILVIVDDKNEKETRKKFEIQSYVNKEIVNLNELDEKMLNAVDMVTYFNNNSFYGKFYLEDMINCFKFADVDFVTKASYYDGDLLIDGVRSNYYNQTPDIYRTIFWKDSYEIKSIIERKPRHTDEKKGYAADNLNYNMNARKTIICQ